MLGRYFRVQYTFCIRVAPPRSQLFISSLYSPLPFSVFMTRNAVFVLYIVAFTSWCLLYARDNFIIYNVGIYDRFVNTVKNIRTIVHKNTNKRNIFLMSSYCRTQYNSREDKLTHPIEKKKKRHNWYAL